MAMEVDGAGILSALARAPETFGMSASQLNALAMATLLVQLKNKALGLEQVRSIQGAIGKHDFALAADHLPARDIAALVKRLDPKNPDLRSSSEAWYRERTIALASRAAEPSIPVAKPIRPVKGAGSRNKVPKTGEVMKSKALKARAPRKPVDAGGK